MAEATLDRGRQGSTDRAPRRYGWLLGRELLVIGAIFVAYRFVRALVKDEFGAAFRNADRVIDWERATELIEGAEKISLSLCYCRHKAEHLGKACDVPQEICLSLNGGANFVVRRGFGRPIDKPTPLFSKVDLGAEA